jgi:hypothetical protein
VVADGREERVDFEVVPDGAPRPGRRLGAGLGTSAFARVMEIAIPFEPLSLARGKAVAVAVHALRGEVEVERLPRTGYVTFAVPDETFERVHWRV